MNKEYFTITRGETVHILFGIVYSVTGRNPDFRKMTPPSSLLFSADAHRLHHISSLAWIDENTLVTTSPDACVKQWIIKF